MMGVTHMTAGLLVGYAAGTLGGLPLPETGVLMGIGAIAALLPDIDHPGSIIRQRTAFVGTLAGWWMSHRGITHTSLAAAVVALVAALLAPTLIAITIAGAYTSHLLLDAFTRSGVPLAWPLSSASVRLLPRPLRVHTGGRSESLFMLLLIGVGVLLGMARMGYL